MIKHNNLLQSDAFKYFHLCCTMYSVHTRSALRLLYTDSEATLLYQIYKQLNGYVIEYLFVCKNSMPNII